MSKIRLISLLSFSNWFDFCWLFVVESQILQTTTRQIVLFQITGWRQTSRYVVDSRWLFVNFDRILLCVRMCSGCRWEDKKWQELFPSHYKVKRNRIQTVWWIRNDEKTLGWLSLTKKFHLQISRCGTWINGLHWVNFIGNRQKSIRWVSSRIYRNHLNSTFYLIYRTR